MFTAAVVMLRGPWAAMCVGKDGVGFVFPSVLFDDFGKMCPDYSTAEVFIYSIYYTCTGTAVL